MKEGLEVSVKKAGKGVWSSGEGGAASTGRREQRSVVCESSDSARLVSGR